MDDFDGLPAEDLFDCIETFGNIDWDDGTKRELLKLYKQKLNLTTERLDTLNLIELGSLVTAFSSNKAPPQPGFFDVTPEVTASSSGDAFDISSIDLSLPSSLDTLSILGTQVTDPDTVSDPYPNP
jgi:hypothetical protein